jgi:ABC-2 type transport system ATP-binding protein
VNAIELSGVTKTFGSHTAVDDLHLAVPRGSVYGFIGPNGSGKTTTLRMIMNILYPDRGEIRVLGEVLHSSRMERIGYMPEERGLYKRMKVAEHLRFLASLKGLKDSRREVQSWLERFDLTAWANKKIETLSKGMAQKVQFIATVVSRPELVILDEPFTGLDPVNTDVLREGILDLQRGGTTVIFSTHDMNMAERMCDFIFMIFRGRKVLDGTLRSIQDQFGNDTIRLRTENGATDLTDLPGVQKVNDYGQMQEIRLAPDTDSQTFLAAIMQRARIQSFDVVRPSLHDIFVRIAGPEMQEANHA